MPCLKISKSWSFVSFFSRIACTNVSQAYLPFFASRTCSNTSSSTVNFKMNMGLPTLIFRFHNVPFISSASGCLTSFSFIAYNKSWPCMWDIMQVDQELYFWLLSFLILPTTWKLPILTTKMLGKCPRMLALIPYCWAKTAYKTLNYTC